MKQDASTEGKKPSGTSAAYRDAPRVNGLLHLAGSTWVSCHWMKHLSNLEDGESDVQLWKTHPFLFGKCSTVLLAVELRWVGEVAAYQTSEYK